MHVRCHFTLVLLVLQVIQLDLDQLPEAYEVASILKDKEVVAATCIMVEGVEVVVQRGNTAAVHGTAPPTDNVYI